MSATTVLADQPPRYPIRFASSRPKLTRQAWIDRMGANYHLCKKAEPVIPTPFQLPFNGNVLKGDHFCLPCGTIVLHGAGQSCRSRFVRLRQAMNNCGIPSAGFDFIGHGETGGNIANTSLQSRTEQAATVIRQVCAEPLTLVGASMSGYTAIRLTQIFSVDTLILLVPAVYTSAAYDLPFGPAFSAAIRANGSWRDSDAFSILAEFKGNLLVIAAQVDDVIPREVVDLIYAAAERATSRQLHIIPESGHRSLFPTLQDFRMAVSLIKKACF